MFASKTFNLPQELIDASKKVIETKVVVEEEYQLTEDEETLFEAFEEYLEKNYLVDQLTEEELEYLFDKFILEDGTDELTKALSAEYKKEAEKTPVDKKAPDLPKTDIGSMGPPSGGGETPKPIISSPVSSATAPPSGGGEIQGQRSTSKGLGQAMKDANVKPFRPSSDYASKNNTVSREGGNVVKTLNAPVRPQQQSRPQAPSMSSRKPASTSSSGSDWKERAFNPGTGG